MPAPRRQAKTSYDPSLDEIFATIDYAAAVPATRIFAPPSANTIRYNMENYETFTVPTLITLFKAFGGAVGGSPRYPNVTSTYLYDGVIVRTPWTTELVPVSGGVGKAVKSPNPVTFAKIIDGTSSTFMIAEKFVRSDVYDDTGVLHYSDDRGWSDGWDADTMRMSCFLPINDSDTFAFQEGDLGRYFSDDFSGGGISNQIWNVYHFGSPHTGGINAVFADGSVHGLSYDIDLTLFNNLATRNGEEQLDKTGIN